MNERYWIKHEMSEAEKRNTQLPCYDEKQNIFCSLIALLVGPADKFLDYYNKSKLCRYS